MKFSIIIPVYNVAPYLRECLDSVLEQTYDSWECICVDDGSSDNSGAILDEYAAKDPRFKVMHQANAGVSAARNAALDVAHGEWVWFVDGDDAIHPQVLQSFSDILCQQDVDALSFKGFWCEKNPPKEWGELSVKSSTVSSHRCFEDFYAFVYGAWSTVFRRTEFKQMKFDMYANSEDTWFFTQMYWRIGKFVAIEFDRAVYFYRQREGGANMGNVNAKAVKDNLEVELKMLRLFASGDGKWTKADIEKYLASRSRCLTIGNNDKMLLISDCERRQVLRTWCALQSLALKLGDRRKYLGLIVAVLRIFPSGKLAYYLIQIQMRARNRSLTALPRCISRKVIQMLSHTK